MKKESDLSDPKSSESFDEKKRALLNLGPPSDYTLNLKPLIKVSKVS